MKIIADDEKDQYYEDVANAPQLIEKLKKMLDDQMYEEKD